MVSGPAAVNSAVFITFVAIALVAFGVGYFISY